MKDKNSDWLHIIVSPDDFSQMKISKAQNGDIIISVLNSNNTVNNYESYVNEQVFNSQLNDEKHIFINKDLQNNVKISKNSNSNIDNEIIDNEIYSNPKIIEETEKRIIATVLFADVSGFTSLSDHLDPEEISNIMNECFEDLSEEIKNENGYIVKYIGDCVMAVFGWPESGEDDPYRCIKASIKMQKKIELFNKKLQKRMNYNDDNYLIRLRIGINTGKVHSLMVGQGKSQARDFMGATVNIASRLEGIAPVGGILVSAATYSNVRGIFKVKQKGYAKLKNVVKPVKTYEILGLSESKDKYSYLSEKTLIGRKKELKKLQTTFNKMLSDKTAQCVSIIAEHGLGKSRLCENFIEWSRIKEAFTITLYLQSHMKDQAFSLFNKLIESQIDINRIEYPLVFKEKLKDNLKDLLSLEDKELEIAYGLALFGLGFPEYNENEYIKTIINDPKQLKQRIFHLLRLYIQHICNKNVLIVFIDNIHNLDEISLEFIYYSLDLIKDLPLLYLFTSSNDIYGRISTDMQNTILKNTILLEKLGKEDTIELIENLLHNCISIPNELMNVLIERGEGNIFYIEEIIYSMIEDNIISEREDGKWEIKIENTEDLKKIPVTVDNILRVRINNLAPKEKEILQIISVLQKECSIIDLNTLLNGNVSEYIKILIKKNILTKIDKGNINNKSIIMFASQLFQDTIYDTILIKNRKELHRKIAVFLENKYNTSPNKELIQYIGYQYKQCNNNEKAFEYYLKSAKLLKKSHSLIKSCEHYSICLSLINQNEDILFYSNLLLELAENQVLLLDFEAANLNYNKALELADNMNNIEIKEKTILGLASSAYQHGDIPKVWKHLEELFKYQQQYQHPTIMFDSYELAGKTAFRQGKFNVAEEYIIKAREIYSKYKIIDEYHYANILHLHGNVEGQLANADKAIEYFQEEMEIRERINDKMNKIKTMQGIANVSIMVKEYTIALNMLKECLKTREEIGEGNKLEIGKIYNSFGIVYEKLYQLEKAKEYYHKAHDIFETIGHQAFYANTAINLGIINRKLANLTKSKEYFRQALNTAEINNQENIVIISCISIILISINENNLNDIQIYLQKGIETAHKACDRGNLGAFAGIIGYLKAVHSELFIKDINITQKWTDKIFKIKDSVESWFDKAYKYMKKYEIDTEDYINILKLYINYYIFEMEKLPKSSEQYKMYQKKLINIIDEGVNISTTNDLKDEINHLMKLKQNFQ